MRRSSSSGRERGSVPTLAVFTIFVIMGAALAMHTFQASYQRQASALQLRMAGDATNAVLAEIEAELNDALFSAIAAAAHEVGLRAGGRGDVEVLVRERINERISAGWSYSNFKRIYVPPVDNETLKLLWLPDGSVIAYGLLGAELEHVLGPRGHGVRLLVLMTPRFERIKAVAERVLEVASGARSQGELEALERGA